MNSTDAAIALGIDRPAVTKAARLGRLVGTREGQGWSFTPDAIDAYRTRHQVGEQRPCRLCGTVFRWHHPIQDTLCQDCASAVRTRRQQGKSDRGLLCRRCDHCRAWFSTITTRQRFCSNNCRVYAFYVRHPDKVEAVNAYHRAYYHRMKEKAS